MSEYLLAYRSVRRSVFVFATMALADFYSHLSKEQKHIVMFWLSDTDPVYPVEVISYPDIASLKLGENRVVDKIIQDQLLTANPLANHITAIFVVQIAGGIAFTLAQNLPQNPLPTDIPESEVYFTAA